MVDFFVAARVAIVIKILESRLGDGLMRRFRNQRAEAPPYDITVFIPSGLAIARTGTSDPEAPRDKRINHQADIVNAIEHAGIQVVKRRWRSKR
jgi:hypothetical protein